MLLMTTLLKHKIDDIRRTGLVPSSFRNCHVRGLHSLMLGQSSWGGLLRMYLTTPEHRLSASIAPDVPMPLAVHAHRYPLTLIPFVGNFTNVEFFPAPDDTAQIVLQACRYTSGLRGQGGLQPTGKTQGFTFVEQTLEPGTAITLAAKDLHTVIVPARTRTAWFVVEGEINPNHEDLCYTNHPMFDTDGMYEPMTADWALDALERLLEQA